MNEELLEATEVSIDDRISAPTVGRYILHRQIARGGMATIHIARLMGDEGFSRIVAAKRLLPEFAEDPEFVAMFLDEARIASRCNHRNLVPVLDVVTTQDDVLLVQEYVHGAPLHHLLNKARGEKERVPVSIAVAIACQVLEGLHAAHELTDEMGTRMDIVHRDVSPQNVMIAVDGTARLLDFGVAKATMAAHVTREGTYKGKLAYSAPEQLHGRATRQSDLYSLAVLLWELLVGHRMHGSQSEAELVTAIMTGQLPTITETLGAEHEWDAIDDATWKQLSALEPIVRKGLAVDLQSRWKTAVDMEDALMAAVRPAKTSEVAAWMKRHGSDYLDRHDKVIATEEASWRRKQGYTTPGTRRTPLPGRLPTLAEGSGNRSMPPPAPQPRRASYILVTVLAMLVGALAIGVVFLMREEPKTATAAPVATPAHVVEEPAKPPPPPSPVPAPAQEQTPVPAPAAETPTAAAPAAEPPADIELVVGKAAPVGKEPVRPRKVVVRQPPPRPAAVKAAIPVKQPETQPAAPAKQDAKAANCTPPYYFEGTKKIFKSECL